MMYRPSGPTGEHSRLQGSWSALGISPSAAVNVFVRKFNEVGGGVPFDVRLSPEPFASEAEACDFADAAARDVI